LEDGIFENSKETNRLQLTSNLDKTQLTIGKQ